jgi:hypothetical protein
MGILDQRLQCAGNLLFPWNSISTPSSILIKKWNDGIVDDSSGNELPDVLDELMSFHLEYQLMCF